MKPGIIISMPSGERGPPGPIGPEGPIGPIGPIGPESFQETNPVFTYSEGTIVRIDYSSGNYKVFTYNLNQVNRIDYVRPGDTTIRKDFTYNIDGTLVSISQTEI